MALPRRFFNPGGSAPAPYTGPVRLSSPKPPAAAFPGALTPAQQQAQAAALVKAALEPYFQELNRQREDAAKRASARGQAIKGFSTAAAGVVGDISQGAGQAQSQMASNQAAFGAGYSAKMQEALGTSAGAANEQLASFGASPEEMVPTDTSGAADVLYGLGGKIPADLMATQGLAASKAAEGWGPSLLGRGQMDFGVALAQGEEAQQKIAQQRIDLQARRPGLMLEALTPIQQQQAQLAASYAGTRQREKTATQAATAKERGARLTAAQKEREALRDATYKQYTFDLNRAKALSDQSGTIYDVGPDGPYQVLQDGKPVLTTDVQADRVLANQRARQISLQNRALEQRGIIASVNSAQGWTRLNGFVSDAQGNPVPDAKGNVQFTTATKQAQTRIELDAARVEQAGRSLALREAKARQDAVRLGNEQAYDETQDKATALSKSGVIYTVARTRDGYTIELATDQAGRPLTDPSKRKRGRTLTPKQQRDIRGRAVRGARAAFQGTTSVEQTPAFPIATAPPADGSGWTEQIVAGNKTMYRNHYPPLSYGEALARGIEATGDPAAVTQALNALFDPGERGRPITGRQLLAARGATYELLSSGVIEVKVPIASGLVNRYVAPGDPMYQQLKRRARRQT